MVAKSRKKLVQKPKAAARKRVAAPKQPAANAAPVQAFPCLVLVKKGGDKLPVQVKDEVHLKKLHEEFGEPNVEVQS